MELTQEQRDRIEEILKEVISEVNSMGYSLSDVTIQAKAEQVFGRIQYVVR